MRYYILTHEHRHGIDAIPFKSQHNLVDLYNSEIAYELGINYEPDSDEFLDIIEIDINEIPEIRR